MKLKAVSGIMLTVLFISMLTLAFDIQPAKASGTIFINADGSIDPPTANITSADKITYTFTGNIYDEVFVGRDNIVVDGAGYTVQGAGSGIGIELWGRSNVTIKNMKIEAFYLGIYVGTSSNHNTISGNNITNNEYGIRLDESSNNTLRNNCASNNKYNFGVSGSSLSHYIHDMDDSNTVDGKPVYYWVNRRDMTVPPDAGCVALVNCTRVTIQNLHLTHNMEGVLLAFTTNSTITKNNITKGYNGIRLWKSSNNKVFENNITANDYFSIRLLWSLDNTISGNHITNNYVGIDLYDSSRNLISGNNITNNEVGVFLYDSSNNSVFENNIIENSDTGIRLKDCSNNSIYHNNFVNNNQQAYYLSWNYPPLTNFWDNGYPSGGNYWSNYTGVDSDHDGIGDTQHVINSNNTDRYPLMNPWATTETSIRVEGTDYRVVIVSNTIISEIVTTENTLSFESSGTTGEKGYINVIFPMVNTTAIQVSINGEKLTPPPFPVINTNGTYYFIYFEFNLSTHSINIKFAPTTPVDGIYILVKKLIFLAPYIGLTILLAVAVVTIAYVKKRKRNTEIIS